MQLNQFCIKFFDNLAMASTISFNKLEGIKHVKKINVKFRKEKKYKNMLQKVWSDKTAISN